MRENDHNPMHHSDDVASTTAGEHGADSPGSSSNLISSEENPTMFDVSSKQ